MMDDAEFERACIADLREDIESSLPALFLGTALEALTADIIPGFDAGEWMDYLDMDIPGDVVDAVDNFIDDDDPPPDEPFVTVLPGLGDTLEAP
jgi:hypothetical protein